MMHPDERPKVKPLANRGVVGLHRVEMKFDGVRLTFWRDHFGARAIGRAPHIDLWTSIPQGIQDYVMALPPGTILDGELHVPGMLATSVVTRLKERSDELVFSPFAVPFYAGRDCRREHFYVIDRMLVTHGFTAPKTLSDPHLATPEVAEAMKIEGFVLKATHYAGWYKVKRQMTVDLVVTDWKPGTKRNEGRIGSLEGSTINKDKEFVPRGSVGGIPDEMREQDPKQFIGRVMEVAYDEVAARGRLKFPRFVRWRDDKPEYECTCDQLS